MRLIRWQENSNALLQIANTSYPKGKKYIRNSRNRIFENSRTQNNSFNFHLDGSWPSIMV